ncbi:MAG: hypothetical protein IH798_00680 [Gemmatimonadetes bacterium]|nr:hypothetical protein [Gemmatimonadota bacterium]
MQRLNLKESELTGFVLDTTFTLIPWFGTPVAKVNSRAIRAKEIEIAQETALDYSVFVRDAYMQQRLAKGSDSEDRLGPDDDFTLAPEMGGLARVLNQDCYNLPKIQKGLKTKADPYVHFSAYSEGKIRHFHELYDHHGLRRLDAVFLEFLDQADAVLSQRLRAARNDAGSIGRKNESQLLMEVAVHLDDFLAQLFAIENEVSSLTDSHSALAPLFRCKRQFVQRKAITRYKAPTAESFDGPGLEHQLVEYMREPLSEQVFARQSFNFDELTLRTDPILSEVLVLTTQALALEVVDHLSLQLQPSDPTVHRGDVFTNIAIDPNAANPGTFRLVVNAQGYQLLDVTGAVIASGAVVDTVAGPGFSFAIQPRAAPMAVDFAIISRPSAAARVTGGLSYRVREGTNAVDLSFTGTDPTLVPLILNDAALQLRNMGVQRALAAAGRDANTSKPSSNNPTRRFSGACATSSSSGRVGKSPICRRRRPRSSGRFNGWNKTDNWSWCGCPPSGTPCRSPTRSASRR